MKQLIDTPQNRDDVLFNLKLKLKAVKKYRHKWFIEKEVKDQISNLLLFIIRQSNQKIESYDIHLDELILTLNIDENKLVPQSVRYHLDGDNNCKIYLFNTRHCVGRIIGINEHYPQLNIKEINKQIEELIDDSSDYIRRIKLDITECELQDVYIGYLNATELEILSPCYIQDEYYSHFPGVDTIDYYLIVNHLLLQQEEHNELNNGLDYSILSDRNLNYGRSRSTKQLKILNNLLEKADEIND